ncbi:MAG: PAS domain S-box protein, partial [Planctomycetaceae bacterium]|nr:PAS domain S-box protein [Planctomycetaceae bacterium]
MTTLFEKTESIELLDRVDLLLSCITKVSGAATSSSLITLIEELRLAILERDERIEKVSSRFDALSRAQADALVYSAEIIDELERTKQHLSDARSAAEKAANDTQRLADTVFERTNDGVLVFCGQECIACNDNVTTLLGTTREEILGSWPGAFDAAFHEDGRSAADDLKSMYANVGHHTPSVTELQLPIQGEGHFWAEVTMSAFSMSDEGHVLVVVRDVTARKQFETELRRQRDFLDNIINAVPDQLSVLSADSRLVLANNAFCKALGVNPEDIIGQNASKLLPHELLSSLHHYDPECSLFDPGRDLVHQTTNADGTHAVLSVKQSRFGDESGDQYLVATARDITRDRAREDRLRLLASVFNGASEGVAILSRNGEICEANPAFLSMTSCDHETSIGQKIEESIRFDSGDFSTILKDVAGGNPWAGKAHASVKGEKDRHFWVSISPSCESHG